MVKYKKTPHVETVTWVDHSYNDGIAQTVKDIASSRHHEVVCQSVGMLIYEDDDKLSIAHEARVDEDFEEAVYRYFTTIYKRCILTRAKLHRKGE